MFPSSQVSSLEWELIPKSPTKQNDYNSDRPISKNEVKPLKEVIWPKSEQVGKKPIPYQNN
jgi:hypothetical protein